ncbi:hypothetical protein TNCV_2403441 [Trichonephila clavipes]|uniref:Uncharacterized protein n=1 Tax=Trichonephila clavipes TaxID=2585209 RepID=A0A8X6R0E1_TRICX|nr:hypothetical protein TNCV_2403441 [Trichonephila clavipes]
MGCGNTQVPFAFVRDIATTVSAKPRIQEPQATAVLICVSTVSLTWWQFGYRDVNMQAPTQQIIIVHCSQSASVHKNNALQEIIRFSYSLGKSSETSNCTSNEKRAEDAAEQYAARLEE